MFKHGAIMVQNGDVTMNLLYGLWEGGSDDVCQYLHAKITDRLQIKKKYKQ